MFVLVKEPVCRWAVKWPVVEADGAVVDKELTLRFVKVGQREFEEMFSSDEAATEAAKDFSGHNRRVFDRLVRGWDGIVDGAGHPLGFSPENIDLLLDYPGFAAALGKAYVSFWLAQPEEREKNSVPSPAGGPATAGVATAEAPASGTA